MTSLSSDMSPTVPVKSRSARPVDDAARRHGTISSSLPKRDASSGRPCRSYLARSNCASSCSCWTALASVRPAKSTKISCA